MIPPTAHHIANFIVLEYGEMFGGFTNMKLQKVLYYVHAWGLVAGNSPITEQFCHWQYGPVIKEVWQQYKGFGRSPVEGNPALPIPDLTGEQKDLIEMIVYSYGRLSAFTLSDLTHSEDPWKNTASGDVIDDAAIKAYYSDETKNPFAKNFPFTKDSTTFTSLWTDGSASFTLDMSDALKEELKTYPSFAAYKNLVDQVYSAENGKSIKSVAASWQAFRAK